MHRLFLGASSAALALAAALPATAQSTASEPSSVQDVIVTAQRREESAQKVGLALTVISGQDLEDRNIRTVNDLENSVPNLEVDSQLGGGQPQFRLRGVGLTDYAANNTSTVGIYVDEVAYPYGVMTQGQLFDIARVEVLRGPQGTLYGRNTTGGAVSVITNAPTNHVTAGLNASYGSYDAAKLEGFVSGPISETLSARLAVSGESGGAWQYNRDTGEALGDKDTKALRFRARWSPSAQTDIDLNLHYSRDKSDGRGLRLVIAPFTASGGSVYPVDTDPRITGWGITPYFAQLIGASPNAKPFRNNTGKGVSLRLNHDLGWAALTAIASYETFDRNEFNDWDATSSNEAGTFFFNDIKTTSQEVRLASPTGGRAQWLAGVYHANESVDGGFYSDFSQARNLGFWMSTTYGQKVQTTGVFGNVDYHLTDRLTLVGGLRYEDETRDLNDFKTQILAPTPSVRATTSKSQHMGQWTGKLGLEYSLGDDILTYANVSRGVKSGGFTTYNSGLPDQLEPFKFEELIAYETGVKSTLFDGRLQLNAAAFYYDYRDQQLQGILYTQTGRVGRMINVPKSHIEGGELELRWRPLDGLTVTQSVGYKYGTYDDFFFVNSTATEAARDPVTGQYNTIVYSDRAGERLPFPRWDYKGSVAYGWNLGGWMLDAETNYNFRSDKYSTSANSIIEGFWLVNANLTLSPSHGAYSVGLYVNNLTNDYSEESRNRFISASTGSPNPPRTWGVRLSYRY
ncbi:TonB-dependent receptor [Brevundimonas sp. SORGH_AS_0993]|uniref:TonB-dependent receptor n=1 Tax=Brevundimonas sp. SORGH_AS_0993 TaxID=3041794 RepID=UPI00278B9703|nr:TonB-dependent receptor [Brevundimonas sp. SORGH_AS_0993]MDQ1153264.1 iron complex outermembrane receptor protein [Brevundimonas sp. SORGH_AS_0993]